jgi:Ca-activated chloride channel family protein
VTRHAPLLSAVSLVVGLAAASSAAAQPAVPVFSAETGLVNVAVTVEDAQGRPLEGLTARDFVVSEDGRRQKVEMCARMGEPGHPSTSLDVALVVDTSDSMLATLRRSQDVTVRFLTSLPNAQEVIVVFFDQTQRVVRFDRDRPDALFERVRTLPEGGNTALRDAIAFSLKALSSSNGRSALVLLTDGIDTVSRTEPAALDRAVQSTAVTIYPVTYPATVIGDGPDPQKAVKDLDRLAQVTGGRLFKLPNEAALPRVLDEIVAELRSQYVLGFTPDGAGAPGRMRKITVKVPGRGKVVVRHRVGYRLHK